MKKILNKEYGITLIALVITIIILLILAGISISALTNTAIFQRTKDAKAKSEEKELEQNQILDSYESEINQYLPGQSGEKLGDKLVDKVNDGTIKIGDYVKYTPDTVSNTDEKYTTLISNLGTYSGSSANTTSTLTQEKLNWRVLDVKDGQVRLISEVPTTSKIALSGYNGYNNSVKLLDDTSSTLYNNSKLASKVQNLKIEDITAHMKTQPTEDTTEYKLTNINYPKILEQEENQTVENSTTGNKIKLSEQKEFVTGKATSATSILKNTYWSKLMRTEYFDSQYYKLFIIDNVSYYSTYWISSRCVNFYINPAFYVRMVNEGSVDGDSLYISGVPDYEYACAFRPVITLNSNVQIDTANSGDGSTAESGYAIK
mgnify:CR=1 FL=1